MKPEALPFDWLKAKPLTGIMEVLPMLASQPNLSDLSNSDFTPEALEIRQKMTQSLLEHFDQAVSNDPQTLLLCAMSAFTLALDILVTMSYSCGQLDQARQQLHQILDMEWDNCLSEIRDRADQPDPADGP